MKLSNYPSNWKDLSLTIRYTRAAGRCECHGECGRPHPGGRCLEVDGQQARYFRGRVMLTVAHLDHNTHSADPDNLKAMCQACHLRYDIDHHRDTRNLKRRLALLEAGQLELL